MFPARQLEIIAQMRLPFMGSQMTVCIPLNPLSPIRRSSGSRITRMLVSEEINESLGMIG